MNIKKLYVLRPVALGKKFVRYTLSRISSIISCVGLFVVLNELRVSKIRDLLVIDLNS